MPRLKSHLDDFLLLRYVTDDLDRTERKQAADHIGGCSECRMALEEIEALDRELKQLAATPATRRDLEAEPLPTGDPFRKRPDPIDRPRRKGADAAAFTARALAASQEAAPLAERISKAAREDADIHETISLLSLRDPAHRFALLYALQQAGSEITRNTPRFLALAHAVIDRVGGQSPEESEADDMVSSSMLLGQAHLLAGQACLWTSELEKAGPHAADAYRFFARTGGAEDFSLAIVEGLESQRRSFIGRPAEALTLARRAMLTFETYQAEDHLARAQVAEGFALLRLDRVDEALDSYRKAQPVFQRLELWSNYVAATNSIAGALARKGAVEDARREYARALRRLSREQHRSLTGFLREGLGEILFATGRHREAALSMALAAKTYADSDLPYRALLASLLEIEAWARFGDLPRAQHRLGLFQAEIQRYPALDPSIARRIAQSLAGVRPDLQKLSELRQEASRALRQELERESA